MLALEILGLEKTYTVGFWRKTKKVGLKPFHLEVPAGEVFGFLGPNGAGKTTTLKLLMGLTFPTAGAARILGRDWRDPAIRARIGFLPEQPYFYDYLTPTELLDYYGTLSGVSAADLRVRIPKLLERVGLAEHARVQLRKFSKGMLQRVGIAQAVLHEPEVVFLDEPMSGLDPVGRREIREFIQALNQEGKTVFFSTHILADAQALCHRVSVLNRGELRGVGVVAELLGKARKQFDVIWDIANPSATANGTDPRQVAAVTSKLEAIGVNCHAAGDTIRATVEEAKLQDVLNIVRAPHARLISVNPVGGSLEEFFLERVGEGAEAGS